MRFKDFMEAEEQVQPLYFGCYREEGHYAWMPTGKAPYKNSQAQFLMQHDGQLAPKVDKKQGAAKLHQYDDFTILAFWDYSVDSRPGSNSMFLEPGHHSFEEMLQLTKAHFPWKKFPFEIYLSN